MCGRYREEGAQPVHLLWILRPSVLVQPDHELLTGKHKQELCLTQALDLDASSSAHPDSVPVPAKETWL